MKPIVDYHMHTFLCGHASGQPHEYIQAAVAAGLEEAGFSDHAPLVSHDDPTLTMSRDQLPQYHHMIEDVRARFDGQIRVRVGIEADFLEGCENKTREILDGYAYDYVIGSVHYIENWGFDDPKEIAKWKQADVDQVYRQYYLYLRKSAQSGLFDIMGHVDLVKKFGHRPSQTLFEEIKKTADTFKDAGVAIEINTSGLRKPAKEMYPALEDLKIYCERGIPLTFGSDAHQPQEVGMDFDKAAALAKEAGYQEYVLFENREICQKVKL